MYAVAGNTGRNAVRLIAAGGEQHPGIGDAALNFQTRVSRPRLTGKKAGKLVQEVI
jgi:hypothetical protein